MVKMGLNANAIFSAPVPMVGCNFGAQQITASLYPQVNDHAVAQMFRQYHLRWRALFGCHQLQMFGAHGQAANVS